MSYLINKSDGSALVVLEDGTLDVTTSLTLVGRNYVGYGEVQNENFVFLLENFANDSAPLRPVAGQVWFDSSNNALNVYDGSNWYPVGSAIVSDTQPSSTTEGALWFKIPDNKLYTFSDGAWRFIGPEGIVGYGTTRAVSTTLIDTASITHPVILLTVNDIVVAICSNTGFTIAESNAVSGFNTISSGITLSATYKVKGNLEGLADRATKLETPRLINGVAFDGSSDITLKSSTTGSLIPGDYIVGSSFNGGTTTTWSVDASSANLIGKVVVRNSAGGFAAGTITANLIGDVQGNVTATSGTSKFNFVEATEFRGATLTGNAFSATKLQTARTINGINFDGTQNITVPSNAQTLSGTFINSTVLDSSLRSVGTLVSLNVADNKIIVGNSTLNTAPSSGTIATQEYVQTSGRNSQGSKTVQPISAGVPANTIGVDGDIIYQY